MRKMYDNLREMFYNMREMFDNLRKILDNLRNMFDPPEELLSILVPLDTVELGAFQVVVTLEKELEGGEKSDSHLRDHIWSTHQFAFRKCPVKDKKVPQRFMIIF